MVCFRVIKCGSLAKEERLRRAILGIVVHDDDDLAVTNKLYTTT
jgi:hypothetical protein